MPSEKIMNAKQSENQSKDLGHKISRRNVLAAGIAAPWIVPRFVLGGTGEQTPGEKLAIAVVGVGGMGRNYIEGCKEERIVALCDLDHTRNNTIEVFKKYPDARRYHDFRKMLDKEAKNFDALIVATPAAFTTGKPKPGAGLSLRRLYHQSRRCESDFLFSFTLKE